MNIIIADNQALTREGMIAVLANTKGLKLYGTASTRTELEEIMVNHSAEILIIDPYYNNQFCIGDLKKILKENSLKILILSNRQSKTEITDAINLGIKNYIFKESGLDEIITAIIATAKSEVFYCEKTMQTLFGHPLPPKKVDGAPLLSYRETEIVQLIADGMANKEIAEKLYLSIHTIKTHRKNIIKKLGFTFKHASELILLLSYLNDFFI